MGRQGNRVTTEERHEPTILVEEAASLFHLLGGMSAKHLIIIGGLVPPLLLPDAPETHVGSADIDLCLSVAITRGATRDYYESIQEKIEPYFEPAHGSGGFRWRKKQGAPGVPLLIDFLAPESDDDRTLVDGTRELSEGAASANAGPQLRPFALRTGDLIDRDTETRTIDALSLVYRPGAKADVIVRFAGPVGFLAAKADALNGRDDAKDGYDVSWWCLHAAGSPGEVAGLVIERPAFRDPLFAEAVWELKGAFRDPSYVGPDGYARETLPHLGEGDDEYDEARNRAYARVSAVIAELESRLFG